MKGKFDLFSPLEFEIGLVLELCEGIHVPGDKLDYSFNCIEPYMKPDASLRQAASCCNGSDNDPYHSSY